MSDRKAKTAEFVLSNKNGNQPSVKQSLNKTMSVLQQAANELAEEEHQDGYETMMIAADLLASERNLSSPLRNSPDSRAAFSQSLNFSQSLDHMNFNGTSTNDRLQNPFQDIHEDAIAFMKDMKFEPISQEINIDDNVNALMNLAEKEGIHIDRIKSEEELNTATTRPLTTHTPLNRSSSARRQRPKSRSSLPTNSGNFNNFSLSCEPSEISLRLHKKQHSSLFVNEIEEILFRSMHVVKNPNGSKQRSKSANRLSQSSSHLSYSSRQYNKLPSKSTHSQQSSSTLSHQRSRVDALSTPREAWSKLTGEKYATLDDAKECTFTPKIGYGKKPSASRSRREDNDDDDEHRASQNRQNRIYAFISRQEAEERARREQQQFNILKKDYDAKIDKKYCPNCRAQQSFDEVREKRKLCPACNIPYVNKISWNQVSKRFFQSNREFILKTQRHRQELLQQILADYQTRTRKVVDATTGRLILVKDTPRHEQQILSYEDQQLFFHRLEEYLALRREKLKAIEEEMYDKREFTFQPDVKRNQGQRKKKSPFDDSDDEEEKRGSGGDDESDFFANSDDERDVVERFLLRYEEDLEQRRQKMPARYLAIRKYHDEIKQREKYMKLLNKRRMNGVHQDRDPDDEEEEMLARSQYEAERKMPFRV